jgi:hypothetical protein
LPRESRISLALMLMISVISASLMDRSCMDFRERMETGAGRAHRQHISSITINGNLQGEL